MDKNSLEYRGVALSFLSDIYERCFKGTASEQEIGIAEKSGDIIRKGNLPEMTSHASETIREEVYANLSAGMGKKRNRRKIQRMIAYSISAVAALAVIVVLSRAVFHQQNDLLKSQLVATNIATGEEPLRQVVLIDGTKIILNQNTQIHYYKSAYNKEKREIWLRGEAFFDVAKDPRRPFVIHSGRFSVRVLGTSFNVKSYPNLNQYTVSVRRGKVDVCRGRKHLGVLLKNRELSYDIRANTFEITGKDCSGINKWTAGSLVLNNADASELVFRMKQYYGVELSVRGKALAGVMINGVYDKTDTPEDVIKSICILYNTRYTSRNGIITVLPQTK